MVELQRSDIDVVATDAASPACLGDEDLLDPAATRSHALHRALRTAVEGSAAGSDELSPPVPGALSRDRGRLWPVPACIVEGSVRRPVRHGRRVLPELAGYR